LRDKLKLLKKANDERCLTVCIQFAAH